MGNERAQIVKFLSAQDEFSPLSASLSANCEMPDVDLSWVFPFIARAIEAGEHLTPAEHQENDDEG